MPRVLLPAFSEYSRWLIFPFCLMEAQLTSSVNQANLRYIGELTHFLGVEKEVLIGFGWEWTANINYRLHPRFFHHYTVWESYIHSSSCQLSPWYRELCQRISDEMSVLLRIFWCCLGPLNIWEDPWDRWQKKLFIHKSFQFFNYEWPGE